MNMIKALCLDVRTNLFSAEILRKYQLGTSANAIRILDALENKEIIDRFGKKIEFMNPVFELWMNRVFAN